MRKAIISRDVTFKEDELLGLGEKTSGEVVDYDVKHSVVFQVEESQETKVGTEEISAVQQDELTSVGQQHESTAQGELSYSCQQQHESIV